MIPLPTMIIVGVIGGLGSIATYGAFHYAEKLGPNLTLADLLPALPPNPPVPRFFLTKPELLEKLRRR